MPECVLMIAYHLPPCSEVSGALRTLSMAEELAAAGYRPIILTPKPLAYPKLISADYEMGARFDVSQTLALDAARHMGLFGRYPEFLARPDRWVSWWLSAVPRGLKLIKRYKPKAIWSTYPIATSHMIASTLHHLKGIPWIADFRDPMVLTGYPLPSGTQAARERLELDTVRNARSCIFVTQRSLNMYAARYADEEHGEFVLIPNGYDEETFASLTHSSASSIQPGSSRRPIRLVHSGLLYPCGRNPRTFLEALTNLIQQGRLERSAIHIVLRASGSDGNYDSMIAEYGLTGVVDIAPMLPRREALLEQLEADGVLLFQGAEFNTQVPAKLYEYFRSGKPIFALVDPSGETAEILSRENTGLVVDLNNVPAIEKKLLVFLASLRNKSFVPLQGETLTKYSRHVGARKLVSLIDSITP